MERKNLIRSVLTVIGRSGRFNPAASRRGIRLAPLLLVAVMLAAAAVLAETSNPPRTAHAHGGDDHTHFDCSGGCPTYDDVQERTVWSATLTAGTLDRSLQAYGYSSAQLIGSLSDTTFSYGGTNYTTDQVDVVILE